MQQTAMRRTTAALALAGGLLAGGLLAGGAGATELTGSVWFPDSHPLTAAGYLDWAKAVEAASGGALTVKVFTGTALLPPGAHLSGLTDGIADLTYHAGTYTPAELPEDNMLAILGIGLTDNVVVASAVSDFYLNDPAMQAMFARHGITFLGGYATPPYILMCREPVTSLAAIQGKKIRMPGAIHAAWAAEVGAVAVNVPSTEMFSGLERGQLDCAANAANDLKSRSLWDVAKHVTTLDLGSYFAGWLWAANAERWAGLTPGERRILLDTISDAIIDTSVAYAATSAEALAEAPGKGVTIHAPDAGLSAALSDFVAGKARASAISEGASRFQIAEPEAVIARFEATLEKWRGLYQGIDRTDAAALKAVLRENLYARIDETAY